MTRGPCLCGDPYCPQCGNPHLAALEDMAEQILEAVVEANLSAEQFEIVLTIIKKAGEYDAHTLLYYAFQLRNTL